MPSPADISRRLYALAMLLPRLLRRGKEHENDPKVIALRFHYDLAGVRLCCAVRQTGMCTDRDYLDHGPTADI